MSTWIYLLRPVRSEMLDAPTPAEEIVLHEHLTRLQQLAVAGTVLLAGPSRVGQDAFGIVVLEVEDEEAARRTMESDPAIAGGVMTGELRPFRATVRATG